MISENLLGHYVMLSDSIRTGMFQQAIRAVVKPGDVVLDIGAGSGILSFFALQAGARHVYALDYTNIIHDAAALAQVNGYESSITFLHQNSLTAALPEKADVVIAELIGNHILDENILAIMVDARTRFLKPGGVLLPQWLAVHVVPVEAPALWERLAGFWEKPLFGLDFSPVKKTAVSRPHGLDCSAARPLAQPAPGARFDFYQLGSAPAVPELRVRFSAEQAGQLHGLAMYFETGLAPQIILSTALDQPLTHWKQVFLPVEEAAAIQPGDEIETQVKMGQEYPRFIFWKIVVRRDGQEIMRMSQFSPLDTAGFVNAPSKQE